MLNFENNLKLYLFKDKGKVSFSVKISENTVNTYDLKVESFETILEKWNTPGGFDGRLEDSWWTVCYKKTTPRPESSPASYVRISVSINGHTINHRVSYQDMYNIQKDYFYQKNNKMYWD